MVASLDLVASSSVRTDLGAGVWALAAASHTCLPFESEVLAIAGAAAATAPTSRMAMRGEVFMCSLQEPLRGGQWTNPAHAIFDAQGKSAYTVFNGSIRFS